MPPGSGFDTDYFDPESIKEALAQSLGPPVSDEMDDRRLADHVLNRKETLKVDLKWQFLVNTPAQKLDFAKDAAAMATTSSQSEGRRGYFVLGCQDAKMYQNSQGAPSFPRFQPKHDEAAIRSLSQTLQQIVAEHCDPPPTVTYTERKAGPETYGLITIVPPESYAVWVKVGAQAAASHQIWIRRAGTEPYKDKATEAEIKKLFLDYARENRLALSEALARVPGHRFVNGITQYVTLSLADERPETRMAAVRAFREIGSVPDVHKEVLCELLIGLLTDRNDEVIAESLRSLAHLGDERLTPAVRAYSDKWREDLLLEAARTLGAVTDYTSYPVLEWLQSLRPASSELVDEIAKARQVIEERAANEGEEKRRREDSQRATILEDL